LPSQARSGVTIEQVTRYAARVDVTVAMFGVKVSVVAAGDDGCIVRLPGRFARLDATGELQPAERPDSSGDGAIGPFTLREFGSTQRLAWSGGGGCSVKARSRVVFWGERWAGIVDTHSITVIDGVANKQARVELPIYAPWSGCVVDAGRLWVGGEQCVRVLELGELQAVLATSERTLPIELRTVYPLRRVDAAVEARVAWMFGDDDALVNIGTQQVRMHGRFGFEKGMTIVLRDEWYANKFALADVPGRPSVRLLEDDVIGRTIVGVVRGKSRDPAASGAAITSTDPRLEQLLAEVARDPDNDANRLVLVDLLQELGASFGTWVAEGGARTKRKEALGPLAHFLDDVEYRGGLPWSAALVRRPPIDAELVDRAAHDLRLGMLSTLRIGKGPRAVYVRFVGSPRAIGLRRVDVNDREIAAALVEAGRTQLTHLHDVRFTKPALIKLLADATFDRVVEIETIVQGQHLAGLLARLEADEHGVFARVPRTLVLRERFGHDSLLLGPALARFPALPIRELRVGGISVRREDDRITARVATSALLIAYWLEPLANALPQLAAIELADRSALLAVEAAFPHATIT